MHAMIGEIRPAWALFLGMGLAMLGNGLQGTLLNLRSNLGLFSMTTIGVVMTGSFVGFLAGSMTTPKLALNVGHVSSLAFKCANALPGCHALRRVPVKLQTLPHTQ